ncbi:MAG: radical SAM protein [Desulfobacterales bacterium]|nr:radical SAM protein [Desulfobacterales bacterium]
MHKQSVVLVNPPVTLEDRYGKDMQQFGAVSEPLGLAYIAGYLEKVDIPVRIIDAPAEGMTAEMVVADIQGNADTLIGINILTTTFSAVRDLARRIRSAGIRSRIVLGGPHSTVLPERTLEEIPHADIACIGEGEFTMAAIAGSQSEADLENIEGICFRSNGKIKRNPDRPFVRELDQIPPPARHMLPMDKYRLTASRVAGDSFCPTIIVARGCPFKCSYCSRTFGRTFRAHSIPRIVAEIESLITKYQIQQVNIEADTLTVKKTFLHDLCQALIKNGINRQIKWTCESRVDTVDAGLLRLMREAGCWQISYGVETGSQRLLDLINKGVTLEQVEHAFELTKQAGITIRGFFMLGLPTETAEESQATIDFAKKIDPLWAQFTITVPYPGTPMFIDLERKGQIRTYDWSRYNTWSGWKGEDEIPFVPEGRSIEELASLQKKALRAFYLRPAIVVKFLRTVRSPHDLLKYFRGFIVLVKSAIQRQR